MAHGPSGRVFIQILVCLAILGALTPQADAGSLCQRRKLQAVNRLTRCRLVAWARSDRTGSSPDTDLAACDAQFEARWLTLDSGSDCLTQGDATSVQTEIASCVDDVAEQLVTRPKVVFTTNALWHGGPPGPGNFTYVSGADARCQETADAIPALQGKTWKAWLSGADPDVAGGVLQSVNQRFAHSSGPYVRTDGVMVALNYAGLTSGSLLAPISKNEHGDPLPDAWGAWTGTNTNGSAAPLTEICRNGSFDWNNLGIGVAGRIGNPAATDSTWTNRSLEDCGNSFHLYCVEQ